MDGMTGIAATVRRALDACLRGLAVAGIAPLGIPLAVASLVSIVYLPLGIGVLTLPLAVLGQRQLAKLQRRWARDWWGVPIASPYRALPDQPPYGLRGRLRWCRWLLGDPATWRDMLWAAVNLPVGILLGILPACLILNGLEGILVSPWLWLFTPGHPVYWALSVPLGVVFLVVGLGSGPQILRGHALFSRWLLGPGQLAMADRVNELAQSRTQVVDAGAAELRRIERDLHDGAQARRVALGMNIGLAERIVRDNPDMALSLLAEARESSGQALSELRSLVRGIHPPVLAERGLDGAVRALALTLPVPVNLDIDLPGRPPDPVESATYFAVAEALTNVAKHSSATRAWVELRHEQGTLTAVVRDNGVGGADLSAGTGLRGVQQRLAAFDGTISVTSPPAGPTVLTMELPCELSSQRISPSSGTA
jgi:signal transduction histidine kinase